jgi:hypothetical protein
LSPQDAPEPPRLEVRRSRHYALIQVVTAAALLALAIAALVQAYQAGAMTGRDRVGAALFFLAIMIFYLGRSLTQLRDRPAFLVIGPDGLRFPAALDGVVPWPKVEGIKAFAGFGKGRIDVALDPEIYAGMRFGSRILGDPLIRRPKGGCEFSILLAGSDHRSPRVYAAMRRYWPPPDATG